MQNLHLPEPLETILARWTEGPTDDDGRELAQYLGAHAEIRQAYVRYMSVHAMLHWRERGCKQEMASALSAVLGTAQDMQSQIADRPAMPSGWFAVVAGKPQSFSLAFAVLAVIFGLAVMAIFRAPGVDRAGSSDLARDDDRAVGAAAVAHVARAQGCRFQLDQTTYRPGDALFDGNELHVAEGLLELRYVSGARAVVEGPVTFRLTGTNSGYLNAGRLYARIPQAASGFTVQTPSAIVVDLGTEFGMEVAGEYSDVVVFEGNVAVSCVEGDGDSASPRLASPSRTLSARETVRVERANGQMRDAPSDGDSFRGAREWARAGGPLSAKLSSNIVYLAEPPKSVVLGALNGGRLVLFTERQGLKLLHDLPVNISHPGVYTELAERRGATPRDAVVDCYYLHFEPGNRRGAVKTRIEFDRPIVGIIAGEELLNASDAPLGHENVAYRQGDHRRHGFLEAGDVLSLSEDRKSLTIDLTVQGYSDQFRVLVESSAPRP